MATTDFSNATTIGAIITRIGFIPTIIATTINTITRIIIITTIIATESIGITIPILATKSITFTTTTDNGFRSQIGYFSQE
jgi:hypothetical protein